MDVYSRMEVRTLGLLIKSIQMPYFKHSVCRGCVLSLARCDSLICTPIVINVELFLIRFMCVTRPPSYAVNVITTFQLFDKMRMDPLLSPISTFPADAHIVVMSGSYVSQKQIIDNTLNIFDFSSPSSPDNSFVSKKLNCLH